MVVATKAKERPIATRKRVRALLRTMDRNERAQAALPLAELDAQIASLEAQLRTATSGQRRRLARHLTPLLRERGVRAGDERWMLASRLRFARRQRELSLTALAARTDIGMDRLRRIEKGESALVDMLKIGDLANELHVTLNWLLRGGNDTAEKKRGYDRW